MVAKKLVCITGASGVVGQACLNSDLSTHFKLLPCSRQQLSGYHKIRTLADVPCGDVLLHLGEDSDIGRVNSKEWSHIESAYQGFCELVEKSNFKHIIYLSSSVVEKFEGMALSGEIDKTEVPNYVRLKLMMEDKVTSLGGEVIRIPNLYGTALVPGTILHDVYTQISCNSRYKLKNSEALIRFLHVQDLVDLFKWSMQSSFSGRVNLSNGAYYKAENVAAFFANCLMKKGMTIHDQVNNSLEPAKSIGEPFCSEEWSEKYSLEEGLKEFVESICEH